MRLINTQTRAIAAIVTLGLALGGCLSKEESNTAIDGGGNGGGTGGNHAPVISGTPPQAVTTGTSYSFTPTASDPDGDPLTFSIVNKPAWASFDSNTGTLSGSPTMADVGSTADISISVSDGELGATLDPFPVDVVQTSLGAVTLSWTPPTENGDGSVLNDLVAYKFYYGTRSGQYTNSVRVDNPGMASYVVDNLVPDTYYFAATAVNSMGVESRYSNEAVHQVL